MIDWLPLNGSWYSGMGVETVINYDVHFHGFGTQEFASGCEATCNGPYGGACKYARGGMLSC